jgi:excisionase family DNA binding protein
MEMVLISQTDLAIMIQNIVTKSISALSFGLPTLEHRSEPEKPINQTDLAKYLGVTEQTISNHRNKGKIPFIQIGSRVLYIKSEVIKALGVNKVKGRTN